MTAAEARGITLKNRLSLEEIMKSVTAMANNGYDYAAFEIGKIAYPMQLKKDLEDLGYAVKTTDTALIVNW